EIEYMRLAAGASQRLQLERHGREIILQHARPLLRRQALLKLRILRRHADRAAAGMAVVAVAGLGADLVIVLDIDRAVAAERDQRSDADRDSIRAKRQRLGHVGSAPDSAGDDELHLAMHVELLKRFDGEA